MTLEDLKQKCSEYINKYPELKHEILDIYTLCLDEIEEGSPVQHEVELGLSSLEDLINEDN
jgi:hypothetical protein